MAGKKEEPLDRVTYQEIDRLASLKKRFQPTDPRSQAPSSGVRIGHQSVFIADEAMPHIVAESAAQACDNIVRGCDSYSGLVYLSRARADDVEALFQASQSPEIRVRWERLWVLGPFFAKLARHPEGRTRLLTCFEDDLAAVHLLSKFVEQKNHSVAKLFKRLHDPLLNLLLKRLCEYQHDARRADLLSSIIATLETDGDTLRKRLNDVVGQNEAQDLIYMLRIKEKDPRLAKLSSEILREKLHDWGGL